MTQPLKDLEQTPPAAWGTWWLVTRRIALAIGVIGSFAVLPVWHYFQSIHDAEAADRQKWREMQTEQFKEVRADALAVERELRREILQAVIARGNK